MSLKDLLESYKQRAAAVQGSGARPAAGFGRESNSGQIRTVAQFLASTYNGQSFPFDLFDLFMAQSSQSVEPPQKPGRFSAILFA